MLKAGTSWIAACAQSLSVRPNQVTAAAKLLQDEATPPFIVRYRADITGGLDEQQVLAVRKALGEHDALEDRRGVVLKALEKKGVGEALLSAVRVAADIAELEDLYAPHKTKANSLADEARAKGLGPLADRVWADSNAPNEVLRKAAGSSDVLHLLAERVSQSAEGRAALRELFWRQASLTLSAPKAGASGDKGESSAGKGGGGKGSGGKGNGGGGGGGSSSADVTHLIGSSSRACQLPAHRTLAINRAESLKSVKVAVTLPDRERAISALCAATLPQPRGGQRAALLQAAACDAYTRLLQPAMARDLRRRLTTDAEAAAARVFASNLASILMQRPVRGVGSILGVDPGFKSGCKLAVIGPTGSVLEHATIHPHPPRSDHKQAREVLLGMVSKHSVGIVAIGDGTASQPTIEFVSTALRASSESSRAASSGGGGDGPPPVHISVVSEAGASVLSVSASAKAAEPHLDDYTIGVRAAVEMPNAQRPPHLSTLASNPARAKRSAKSGSECVQCAWWPSTLLHLMLSPAAGLASAPASSAPVLPSAAAFPVSACPSLLSLLSISLHIQHFIRVLSPSLSLPLSLSLPFSLFLSLSLSLSLTLSPSLPLSPFLSLPLSLSLTSLPPRCAGGLAGTSAAGSARRARQDRSKGHRRRYVPA